MSARVYQVGDHVRLTTGFVHGGIISLLAQVEAKSVYSGVLTLRLVDENSHHPFIYYRSPGEVTSVDAADIPFFLAQS